MKKAIKVLIICVILLFTNRLFSQYSLPAGTEFFHTYNEMKNVLENYAQAYPNICKYEIIGESRGKEYFNNGNSIYQDYSHDILAIKISDNVLTEEDEPSIYFMGLHHGNELLSLEVVMDLIKDILVNYSSNPSIQSYVNNYQIWFVPSVNPNAQKISEEITPFRNNIKDNGNGLIDVLEYYWTLDEDAMDCMSGLKIPQPVFLELQTLLNHQYADVQLLADDILNLNSFPSTEPEKNIMLGIISTCINEYANKYIDGKDLNRNYHTAKSSEPDPLAWTEPESRSIRNFFGEHHFVFGVSYHGYLGVVLRPFSYERTYAPPDKLALNEIGNLFANNIQKTQVSGNTTYYLDENFLYDAEGTSTDYGYGFHGIFNYTVEIEQYNHISRAVRDDICQANLPAAYYLLDRMSYAMLTGHVKDRKTGNPIQAKILVEGIDDFNNPDQLPIHKSDASYGRYYRVLNTGSYDVTFIADGYQSASFTNININNDNLTELEVELMPECTGDDCIFADLRADKTTVIIGGNVNCENLSYAYASKYIWEIYDERYPDEPIHTNVDIKKEKFTWTPDIQGTYIIKLSAFNSFNEPKDQKTTTIRVVPVELFADFTYDHSNTTAGQTITFNDKSSSGESTITKWEWEVLKDNGSKNEHYTGPLNDQNPEIPFITEGTYFVVLTITDDKGQTATEAKEIIIYAREEGLTAAFDFYPAENIKVGDPISFSNQSTGFDYAEWDMGDETKQKAKILNPDSPDSPDDLILIDNIKNVAFKYDILIHIFTNIIM